MTGCGCGDKKKAEEAWEDFPCGTAEFLALEDEEDIPCGTAEWLMAVSESENWDNDDFAADRENLPPKSVSEIVELCRKDLASNAAHVIEYLNGLWIRDMLDVFQRLSWSEPAVLVQLDAKLSEPLPYNRPRLKVALAAVLDRKKSPVFPGDLPEDQRLEITTFQQVRQWPTLLPQVKRTSKKEDKEPVTSIGRERTKCAPIVPSVAAPALTDAQKIVGEYIRRMRQHFSPDPEAHGRNLSCVIHERRGYTYSGPSSPYPTAITSAAHPFEKRVWDCMTKEEGNPTTLQTYNHFTWGVGFDSQLARLVGRLANSGGGTQDSLLDRLLDIGLGWVNGEWRYFHEALGAIEVGDDGRNLAEMDVRLLHGIIDSTEQPRYLQTFIDAQWAAFISPGAAGGILTHEVTKSWSENAKLLAIRMSHWTGVTVQELRNTGGDLKAIVRVVCRRKKKDKKTGQITLRIGTETAEGAVEWSGWQAPRMLKEVDGLVKTLTEKSDTKPSLKQGDILFVDKNEYFLLKAE